MRFSDWIKQRIEDLRAIIVPDEPPPVPPDGVEEIPLDNGLELRFLSNTANLGRARKAVERFCESTQLDQPARDEIGLVVNEAIANIMRHAYDGAADKPIEIKLIHHEGGVRILLRDWGTGVVPNFEILKKDPLVPGGLGLICMKKLMDEVKFTPQHEGMLLEVTRTTGGSKAARIDAARTEHRG